MIGYMETAHSNGSGTRRPHFRTERIFAAGLAVAAWLAAGAAFPTESLAQSTPTAPKAKCGANDRQESGLQGQTTLAERFAPGPTRAFNCNLNLVGQYAGEGAAWGLGKLGDCAY